MSYHEDQCQPFFLMGRDNVIRDKLGHTSSVSISDGGVVNNGGAHVMGWVEEG